MTPERFIERLGILVSANRGEEALALWRRHYSEMKSGMTSEQIVWVADLMHMADMVNDLDSPSGTLHPVEAVPQTARST